MLMKALNSFGFPVLRFNFRGTGFSAGQHDEGRGEIADVRSRAHLAEARVRAADHLCRLLVWLGHRLRAACPDPDVEGADLDRHTGRSRWTDLLVFIPARVRASPNCSSVAIAISTARTRPCKPSSRRSRHRRSWYSFPEIISSGTSQRSAHDGRELGERVGWEN